MPRSWKTTTTDHLSSTRRAERFVHSAAVSTPRSFSQRPYVGPPGSTELWLVRHGASADSVEGETFELVEGQGDPPLSEAGPHPAQQHGVRLAQEPFDGLYVSTLQRTAQTAEPLVARSGLTPA